MLFGERSNALLLEKRCFSLKKASFNFLENIF